MPLTINTESSIDAILKMGQANEANASAGRMNAAAAQQVAETQAYTADSAKQMRESKNQAAISAAQVETQQNEATKSVYDQNPSLLPQMVTSGAYDQMTKHYTSMSDNQITAQQNTIGQALSPDGTIDPTAYKAGYDKATAISPTLVDGLPTPDQVAQDPKAMKTAAVVLAHGALNQEQRFKAAEQEKVLANKSDVVDAISQARLQASAMMANAGINKAQIAANARVQAADIYSKARVQSAQIRNSGGKPETINQVMGAGNPLTTLVKGNYENTVQELQTAGITVDEKSYQGVTAKLSAEALSEWNKQNQDYFAHKTNVPPSHPQEIYDNLLENLKTDPKAKDNINKGLFKDTWKGGAPLPSSGTAAPAATSATAPVMNERQSALSKDPAFSKLSQEEQQHLVDQLK